MPTSINKSFQAARYYIKGIYISFQKEDVLLFASGLSFYGLFCLVPLLLLLTALFGIFLSSSEHALQHIEDILSNVLLTQPYAEKIKSAVEKMIGDAIRYRESLGVVGIALLAWTASSLFSATRSILNRIYKLQSSRLAVLNMLEDMMWVAVIGVLFLVTNIAPLAISVVQSMVKDLPVLNHLRIGFFARFTSTVFTTGLSFIMFLVVYRFVPAKGVPTKTALVSAITTTVLWAVSSRIFRWYLLTFHSYRQLYGAYAFIIVLLVWVYYSAIIFILGAIVGQLHRERKPY